MAEEDGAATLRELRARCEPLIEFPTAAPLRPALGDGIRMVVFGRYLIFHVVGGLLEIRRAVHAARDLGAMEI